MKYHAVNQIRKVFELQSKAAEYQERIDALLKEADELTSELKGSFGDSFVLSEHDSTGVFNVVYKAIGHGIAGNMNWLEANRRIRIIRNGE